MEPTDFEKWCAEEMSIPLDGVIRSRFGDGYKYTSIHTRYRAYVAGVRSRLPYQTPPKGDEDEMD
ncbi:hypothetical protein ZZ27_23135 [Salmonella enterica subsp. enterica serovar Virchow]|nr:hypothetical protein [Salmonella enterica subsp. enterica serovar Virchow]